MALVSTAWPDEPVPENVRSWLADLFGTVDENVPDAPQKFASFFTDDALVRTGAGPATGRAGPSPFNGFLKGEKFQVSGLARRPDLHSEIIASRSTAWDHVQSRKHEILRVYVSKRDYTDLLACWPARCEVQERRRPIYRVHCTGRLCSSGCWSSEGKSVPGLGFVSLCSTFASERSQCTSYKTSRTLPRISWLCREVEHI